MEIVDTLVHLKPMLDTQIEIYIDCKSVQKLYEYKKLYEKLGYKTNLIQYDKLTLVIYKSL